MKFTKPNIAVLRLDFALPMLVLALAALLRLNGIDFGLPALNDADELMFELGGTKMLTGQTLNPGWFGHPATTTMYMLAFINAATFLVGWLAGQYAGSEAFMAAIYADPGIVILPGRVAIAVFGMLTVWQVWRLGRQLDLSEMPRGRSSFVALFSALLIACSPLHITFSQIIRSDMMGTAFMLLCIGAALRIAEHGRTKDYRWAALWLALAVASKWPFAVTALAVAGAASWRMMMPEINAKAELKKMLGFAWLAPALLIVISPFLILDFETVLVNLTGEARSQHLGATGGGFFDNAWFYFQGPLRGGLGIGALMLSVIGLVQLARERQRGFVIIPVLVAHLFIICLHGLRWERWALPILPLLALMAGLGAKFLLNQIREWTKKKAPMGAAMALLIVLPLLLIAPALSEANERKNDTRQQATAWGNKHIPAGSTVLVEHFAFDMFDQPWEVLFPLGDTGCVNARDMLAGRIDYQLVEEARAGRSNIDYGTVAAQKRESCRADFAILTQMDRYRAEQERFPDEHHAYQLLLDEMELRATLASNSGKGSGPVVTILALGKGQETDPAE